MGKTVLYSYMEQGVSSHQNVLLGLLSTHCSVVVRKANLAQKVLGNTKKGLNNKMDAIILKLCTIMAEHHIQCCPSFSLQ